MPDENLMKTVANYGFLIVFASSALMGIAILGRILSRFLLEEWNRRQQRITDLELKIDAASNGMKASLEKRLDESTAAQVKASESGQAIAAALHSVALVISKCPGGGNVKV